jgi:hypothetical protein
MHLSIKLDVGFFNKLLQPSLTLNLWYKADARGRVENKRLSQILDLNVNVRTSKTR